MIWPGPERELMTLTSRGNSPERQTLVAKGTNLRGDGMSATFSEDYELADMTRGGRKDVTRV